MLFPLVGAVLFGALGLGACWLAVSGALDYSRRLARCLRAPGLVYALREESNPDGLRPLQIPQIRFTTGEGAVVEFESRTGGGSPARYAVGQTVAVVYDRAASGEAEIEGGEWTSLAVIGGFGVLGLLVGLACLAAVFQRLSF